MQDSTAPRAGAFARARAASAAAAAPATRRVVRAALVATVAIALPLPSQAVVSLITVGGDDACEFDTRTSATALQDAVDAVPETVPAGDLWVVRVARTGNYLGTDLTVANRSLLVEGGYQSCASPGPDTTRTTINRNGRNGAVVTVQGSSVRKHVTLANLRLMGAQGHVAHGLRVSDADVTLRNVEVQDNVGALRGAGVQLESLSLGASLDVGGGSIIHGNSASQEGGGIYCARGAALRLDADSGVFDNVAGFAGGGIYIDGCSGNIDSGKDGLAGLFASIRGNQAGDGGGIYLASSLGPTDIVIGKDSHRTRAGPLVSGNVASGQGGGIMVVGADTRLTLRNTRIIGNTATSVGGGLLVRNGPQVVMDATRPCDMGRRCSRLYSNTARDGGALAVAGTNARLIVRRTRIDGNTASEDGSALYNQGGGSYARLENTLVTGNSGGSVVHASDPWALTPRATTTELVASTLAGNLGASRVLEFNAEGSGLVRNSIIHAEGAVAAVGYDGMNEPVTACSVFHEVASLGSPGPGVVGFPVPGFVNAPAGDYRLLDDAFSVDRCAAGPGDPVTDIDLQRRPYDMPLANLAGAVDAGAFEANEILFRDGFE